MRRGIALVIIGMLVAGCAMLADLQGAPKPCVEVYSEARCLAMMDVAAAEVGRNRGDVTAIAIVPQPPREPTLGGGPPIQVRIGLADGTIHDAMMCGLLSIAPACSDEPRLSARSVMGGYSDVPCGAEPADAPEDCATPFPPPKAEVVAAAAPVLVEESSIPIDHVGQYEVPLGQGSLPNGILTEASFDFAEAWPDDIALADGAARLELRSLEPDGKPFENYYMHGWRPGVERVRAVLTFEVLWFAPGAVLEIRNVVVR